MRSLGHQGMKSVWFITKNSYIQGLRARRVYGKNRRVQYFFFMWGRSRWCLGRNWTGWGRDVTQGGKRTQSEGETGVQVSLETGLWPEVERWEQLRSIAGRTTTTTWPGWCEGRLFTKVVFFHYFCLQLLSPWVCKLHWKQGLGHSHRRKTVYR